MSAQLSIKDVADIAEFAAMRGYSFQFAVRYFVIASYDVKEALSYVRSEVAA